MAYVFSTINLKGGVGKTTTTVAMAEFMSGVMGKKVLVIDLDPQTNATIMMIGEDKWRELNDKKHTIARLFEDALEQEQNKKCFDFDATLQKRVSNVKEANSIDLLPSSLDLIAVQDRLAFLPTGQFIVSPIDLLRRAVRQHLDNYDIVIIDCPPNLGLITQNGLRISNGFVIPTIPDFLSTYGIDQILSRVKQFSAEIAEDIDPLGIVITKYQANSTVHRNTLEQLRSNGNPTVFDNIIRQANQFASAAEYVGNPTLKQKWGYGLAEQFEALTKEIMSDLEG